MEHTATPSQQLSRSASAASISSVESSGGVEGTGAVEALDTGARRTRKRFTNEQLMMLELLYRETSHPTREQRDALAKGGDMEVRSVTVWFQNKRQAERRENAALHGPAHRTATGKANSPFSEAVGKTIHTELLSSRKRSLSRSHSTIETARHTRSSHTLQRTATEPLLAPPRVTQVREALSRQLSLDHIATLAERPHPPDSLSRSRPRTPLYPITPPKRDGRALWENMLSSPPGLSPGPQADRLLLEYGCGRSKRMRTLEWACAAARIARLDAKTKSKAESQKNDDAESLDLGGDTEEEGDEHEAVTPRGSQVFEGGRLIRRWDSGESDKVRIEDSTSSSALGERSLEAGKERAEVEMDAALVLCDLGKK